ncbi:SIMPL domain-containing protein [Occallatibacter riparius]|uniref:SIMPL domain-containing protein n=1 Tax=Occallatibacter riparius TaxID=1002689 RepID=A0A9J7BQI9_9BACT|nr:SIMPL domain-containing protein [Occallatibacter riparius]UWZ83206.1 SIMPL domain-containing protein [Occallatibacter riparius]
MRCAIPSFLAVAVSVSAASSLIAQCNQNCPERRTVSVNGSASVTADADLAIVRVGYKLYGPDAKAAYSTATATSNAIMQALIASGVKKNAIESTSQVLQHTQQYETQQYPINSPERVQHEFTALQNWTVRVKPDDAANVLNTAINAGANESGWIEWIVEHPESLQAEAAARAEGDAHATAERIAQMSGVRLGRIVSVTENQGSGSAMDSIGALSGPVVMALNSAPGSQPLAVNSRQVTFHCLVYAVFEIE